jgi:hypothetical protein
MFTGMAGGVPSTLRSYSTRRATGDSFPQQVVVEVSWIPAPRYPRSVSLFPASYAEHLERMVQTKHIAALLITACLASTAAPAASLEAPSVAEKVTIEPRGRAYLFRGLIALIDWGMDELAQRIDLTGVTADINSHLMWAVVANQAISDYRRDPEPITVIGHSIGGDSAVAFARYLDAADTPVNLLVTYDPTRFADNVPSNVERYINLYQSS